MRIEIFGDSLTTGVPGVSYVDMLRDRFPGHTIIPCAQGGDSVIGALRRAQRMRGKPRADVTFVFIGVNDVFAEISPSLTRVRGVLAKPRTRSPEEFSRCYRRLLDVLLERSSHVLAVCPLAIGEDPHNPWNRKLDELCSVIRDLAEEYPDVQHVDMRERFFHDVADGLRTVEGGSEGGPEHRARSGRAADPERGTGQEHYLPTSASAVVRDAIMLRTPAGLDAVSSARGLVMTLDGVHLNSRGARMVAGVFGEALAEAVSEGEG